MVMLRLMALPLLKEFVLIGPLVEEKTTLPVASVGNVARKATLSLYPDGLLVEDAPTKVDAGLMVNVLLVVNNE